MLAETNLGSISFLGAGSGQQPISGITSARFGGGFQSILHSLRNGPGPRVGGQVSEDLEQALAGFFNLLAGHDIQQVQVASVNGQAVSDKLLAAKSLMPESRPVGRADVKRESRQEATVAERRAEGVTSPKPLAAEQTKASAKLEGFAGAVKLADAEVVERLRSVIAAAHDLLPGSGRKKMRVALNSESKGKFVVEIEQTTGHSKSRVYVDSRDVEKWLRQQLSQKGIQVDEIVVRSGKSAKGSRAFGSGQQTASASVAQRQVISGNGPDVPGPTAAVGNKGPATSLGKSHSLASALSRDAAGSSLSDEASLSDETETKKAGIQLADEPKVDSERFGESFGARVAAFEEGEGEKMTFSSANGTGHFESVNGRLVATNAVHGSSMADMIQKISELVEQQAKATKHKLEVQMEVKDVGKVLVDATKQANKVNLHVHVESIEARRLLEAQLRPLVEQMAKEGIDIGKLDVSVRDDKADEQARFEFSQENHDRRDFKSEQEANRFKDGGQHLFTTPEAGRNQLQKNENGNQTLEIWA